MRRSFVGVVAILLLLPGVAGAQPEFEVTTNPFTVGQAPSWMPDGVHVVYHADRGEGMHLYRARLSDGAGLTCLTCGQPEPNMVPDVRPQGDKILFHSWRGTNITIGAPGFGGLGSDLWVVDADGSDPVALTADHDGYDNYHAYWSPDGNRIVWTRLNWNFVTDTGRGHWDIRVADYVEDATGPHLANIRVVHEGPGHYFETQHWSPDGKGFLYTESIGNALNLELFYCDLSGDPDDCAITQLTDDPAWDEQAIFTPDGTKVIFMSTRDSPSLWQTWANASWTTGLPADLDYLTILPMFAAGFLQPVAAASTNLYEIDLATKAVRRLTFDGDDGWIIPEFAWDPAGERLLWTEQKFHDGVRVPLPPDPVRDATELAAMLQDPPLPDPTTVGGPGPNFLVAARTRIGGYVPRS